MHLVAMRVRFVGLDAHTLEGHLRPTLHVEKRRFAQVLVAHRCLLRIQSWYRRTGVDGRYACGADRDACLGPRRVEGVESHAAGDVGEPTVHGQFLDEHHPLANPEFGLRGRRIDAPEREVGPGTGSFCESNGSLSTTRRGHDAVDGYAVLTAE